MSASGVKKENVSSQKPPVNKMEPVKELTKSKWNFESDKSLIETLKTQKAQSVQADNARFTFSAWKAAEIALRGLELCSGGRSKSCNEETYIKI
ncbi:hypothetical protein VNI00_016185 [Paramarasmius palmivorus]|uniref:Uncharacterized protein n=1 Tax=Paramarasmius palmivorus TaxID=297713 RepID=A0AAW0BD19_9AGAR